MTDLRLTIAQHLTTIERLCRDLTAEAEHRFADKEYPGGPALTMLGPVANIEAWNYQQLSELMGRTYRGSGADDLDSDPAPPLLVLGGWCDVVAEERGDVRRKRATIKREADYLRFTLDWIVGVNGEGEPYFLAADELDRDLAILVRRLEAVLHDGDRSERSRVTCISDRCDAKPRLVKVYANTSDPKDDGWRCPACHQPYNPDEFTRAKATQMHSEAAGDAWIKISDAAHSIGRPDRTLRTWITAEKVSTQITPGPPTSIYVLWSDIRIADQEARTIAVRRKHQIA